MRCGVFRIERDRFCSLGFGLFGYGDGGGSGSGGGSGLRKELCAEDEVAFGLEIGAVSVSEFGEEFLGDVVHSEEHEYGYEDQSGLKKEIRPHLA